MDLEDIIRIATQGMMLCLYLSLPVIVVSTGIGLLVSFIQAVTSLQDQSLSYGIKLIVTILVLIISSPWCAAALLRFANEALTIAVSL